MVQINFALKEVNCKIVFYGPGMSGKTTNLEIVHQKAPESNRGDLTSISTDGDRTLFFDFMPLDLGTVAGMRTKFQLYTVPGQVYYNSTRKLVLQGVDGVIFVADSDPEKLAENIESYENLLENLNEYGKDPRDLPHVIQYNKRDLPNAMPVEDLDKAMNKYGVPTFEAVANTGEGVFPTLKTLAGMVLESIDRMDHRRKPTAAKAGASAPQGGADAPAAKQPSRRPAPRSGGAPQPASGRRPASQPKTGGGRGSQRRRAPAAAAAAPAAAPGPRSGRPAGARSATARPAPQAAAADARRRTAKKGGMNLVVLSMVLLAAAVAGVVYFVINNPEF
jgi:hypothetical protein